MPDRQLSLLPAPATLAQETAPLRSGANVGAVSYPPERHEPREPAPAQEWHEGCCHIDGCTERAAVRLDGEALCIECVDAVIEREAAVMEYPAMRELLPRLTDR